MNKKNLLDIGEVKKESGLAASALRFYEEKGLIKAVARDGLRRQYDANIIERLTLISLGRQAGFTLEEIRKMFTPDGKPKIDRVQLWDKATQLNKTIKQLIVMRDGLRHAAKCPAPSHMECSKFRRILRLAGKSSRDKTKKR